MQKPTIRILSRTWEKNEGTIKKWKSQHPELLELVRLGMLCRANGIDEVKLNAVIAMLETLKETPKIP